MWQSYTPPFYLKMETLFVDDDTRTTYILYVTNYVKLWSQNFSKLNLLKIMSDSNPDLEFTNEETFLLTGLHLLNNPHDINSMKFTEAGDELNISLVRITGFVMKMNFNLPVCSPQYFFDIVTRPLLLIIDDLKKSEDELRTLLKQKDQEITLFAQECGENFSMMKCFSTPKYVDQIHMKKHNVYDDLMGSHENCVVPNAVLNSHPLPQPSNIMVKKEPLETAVSSTTSKVKKEPTEDNIVTSSNPFISQASTKRDVANSSKTVLKTDPSNEFEKEEPTESIHSQVPKKIGQSNLNSISHTQVSVQSPVETVSSETKLPETDGSQMRVSVDVISNGCTRTPVDVSMREASSLDSVNTQARNEIRQWSKKSPVKRKKLNY